jgi:NADH-quinone oxidoreductase subunit A
MKEASAVYSPAIPIVLLSIAAVLVGAGMLAAAGWLSRRVGARRWTETKLEPFESGMPSEGYRGQGFSVKFFLVAILFILFDVEIAVLYPWAVIFRELGLEGLGMVAFFLGLLLVGYVYAWKRGALDWRRT